ncbi:MAG TPA: S53 family peptidase [Candidatus Cybelea sp.]|nr:S53 family peptidase [Candidatus Cybelea sp.]
MKAGVLRYTTACAFALCLAGTVSTAENRTIAHETPSFVQTARDLGPEDLSKQITIYVWLQIHNEDSLRQLVQQEYDESSASYRVWLTRDQFDADFAPTRQEVETVQRFLAAYNLKPVSVGSRNLYVKAVGAIADVQRAFTVEIHRFSVRGEIRRANLSDPSIEGSAGSLVSWVGGLSDLSFKPHNVRAVNPATGEPNPPVALSAAPNGAFFSANCFRPPETASFSDDGRLPRATYFGNRYGADITNTQAGTLPPCGYQPSDVQTAYGLDRLYQSNLDGTGQTVVIVDAYGSPTIETDASTFSSFYGLEPLDLQIYQPIGPPTKSNAVWATETSLDVEWVHSVAPGASIALIEAPTASFDELAEAVLYAVDNDLGNVISNSYGVPESELGGAPFTPLDDILIVASSEGISVDYSSGDDGDFYAVEKHTDVSYPASSPYATGVGGTSLALKADKSIAFQTGWGNNATQIAAALDSSGSNPPVVPPLSEGFQFGAGGGASSVYPIPRFQRRAGLRGAYRLVPDVSYVADPFTGVEVFCTGSSCFGISSSDIFVAAVGGTSLACPMFSGMWAISNQGARYPLGQAAASVYSLPPGAVTDIVPVSSPFNVFGLIQTATGVTFESAFQLAAPTHAPFFSALYNDPSTPWYVLTFGTDSSLSTSIGWDDVTGVGTPNGINFVNAVSRRH